MVDVFSRAIWSSLVSSRKPGSCLAKSTISWTDMIASSVKWAKRCWRTSRFCKSWLCGHGCWTHTQMYEMVNKEWTSPDGFINQQSIRHNICEVEPGEQRCSNQVFDQTLTGVCDSQFTSTPQHSNDTLSLQQLFFWYSCHVLQAYWPPSLKLLLTSKLIVTNNQPFEGIHIWFLILVVLSRPTEFGNKITWKALNWSEQPKSTDLSIHRCSLTVTFGRSRNDLLLHCFCMATSFSIISCCCGSSATASRGGVGVTTVDERAVSSSCCFFIFFSRICSSESTPTGQRGMHILTNG